MEMPAEVKALGIGEFLVGVVENVKAVDGVFGGEGEVVAQRVFAAGGVVVAFDDGDGDGCGGEPGEEDVEDLAGAADTGVEEVAGNGEMVGLGCGDELVDAGEVGVGVALGDGKAAGAKSGGFAKVGVGENEGA